MYTSERIPERRSELAEETKEGRSSPLGATLTLEGANFSVYSKHATGIELLLFDCVDDARSAHVIRINPSTNRTYHYWHVFVPGVKAGQIYGYRVEGPFDPPSGMRFDPAKVLVDPYGRGVVVPKNYSREAARRAGDNATAAMKSVVVDPRAYDWEGDRPLNRLSSQTIVYEMHVRGFTYHPSSGVAETRRGTFAGLIEVILDVVFNHTAEGNYDGPTLCFRGLDNDTYYILEQDRARYANFSGTGNTLNANHPIVRRMILDSLRYWVEEMHVDGFRFDLAAILGRDESGHVMSNPPVLWDIESDPALAGTKLIAEAWDAAGLYEVGSFIGDSWKEWNGRFRDDVRSFFRGEEGSVGRFADRLLGSPAIYGHKEREAEESVNYVTCHDGFTLNDLVSYDHKHNEANGEDNRDGKDDNRSWNCGVEGPTDDPGVGKLRNRQVKNFLTVTMLSVGMPMLLMGDEVRRTQRGNNNAYCQDNETSWFDWTLLAKHADVHRFVTLLNARRLVRDLEPEGQGVSLNQLLRGVNLAWHGVKLDQPDWGEYSHSIAFTAENRKDKQLHHVILNAYWQPLDFELPRVNEAGETPWRRWIDTALDSPHDILQWNAAETVPGYAYRVEARSVVMLFAGV
jgi:pullulanase/glycogen debranching enzyme